MTTQIADSDWILAGAGSTSAVLIKKAMRIQPEILDDFPEEEKQKADGFALRLIIDGEDGGEFLLMFSSKRGLEPKSPGIPIRNTVWSDEDTLVSLGTLDVSDFVLVKPDGTEITGLEAFVWAIDNGFQDRLPEFHTLTTILDAVSEGKIRFGGDVPQNVDMVRWQGIYNEALNHRLIPMVKEMMVTWAKKAKESAHVDE